MGFNFQSAHPTRIFDSEYGERVATLLADRLGAGAPLGSPGDEPFCLNDELGWSWWQELQAFVRKELGDQASRQITSTDAWQAVYVDAKVDRALIWPDGEPANEPPRPAPAKIVRSSNDSLLNRLLRRIGLRPAVPSDIDDIMRTMVAQLGARKGENGAMQVGNLPALMGELTSLLLRLQVEPNITAVENLRRSYSDNDDRVDDDPAIQCLCHAWLTARHALDSRAPLWLVK